ncbi:MAG TPA: di-heme-cytochrome C peroxidase, partial [Bradyrhizobium sp.]|nr:di-heme-cytochrome C peroxidase [Bradyrhizobium sp.]
EKISTLKPPPWPFEIKPELVDKGRILFARECGRCHEEKRLPLGTWLTPVMAVGTDPKMFDNSQRTSQTGTLAGALSPNPPGSRLSDPAATGDVLATTVVGALVNEAFPFPPKLPNSNSGVWQAIRKDLENLFSDSERAPDLVSLLDPKVRADLRSHVESRLANMFKVPGEPRAYESRVLHGIWATAPYLHNGSVPNLWELLTPPDQRKPFFMVGSKAYDRVNVGYVTDSSPFKDGKLVVGSGAEPGNSNAGHDFGKDLTDDEKWQLIEYLKQL